MSRARLALEPMEDRTVPAPVVNVVTLADAHEGGSAGAFRFTRLTDPSAAFTASYRVAGSATPGTDYAALSGTVTFAPFVMTVDVTVAPVDDGAAEPTEYVTAALTPGAGYIVGSPVAATLRVFDNETPEVTVAAVANAAEGGSNGTFRFTRIGDLSSSLAVNYTVSGTATSGTDFTALSGTATLAANASTADVTVAVADDTTSELTETVIATVGTGTGYTVGDTDNATVNILDNDAQVVTVEKITDAVEGGNEGTFRFTRTGNLSGTLTVNYIVSGTAASGTDFTALSGTVTFAAGEATADVTVETIDDNTLDPDETVVVTVATGTGYSIGTADEAEVNITDSVRATFTVNSYLGAIKYTIPWGSVDLDEATQSLTPTAFSLNIGGQNFVYGTANYTSAPKLLFEYGDLVGIEFDLDLTGTGSAFSGITAANGEVDAVDDLTTIVYNAPVESPSPSSITLDFAAIDIPGAATETSFRVTRAGKPAQIVKVEISPGATKTQVRDAYQRALLGIGINATPSDTTGLTISGDSTNQLTKIEAFGFDGSKSPKLLLRTKVDTGAYPDYVP